MIIIKFPAHAAPEKNFRESDTQTELDLSLV